MSAANADEYSVLLANWADRRSRLDAEYTKLKNLFGADPGCSPVKAMYDTFQEYTEVLAALVGDEDGWLEWYAWENDNGAAKLEAKASNWAESKPIATTDDLLVLIDNVKTLSGLSSFHSLGSMYNCWFAFVDINRDRLHEFPTYDSWICSDDAEARSFRQGWAARWSIEKDPNRYPDPIDFDFENIEPTRSRGSDF